MIKYFKMSDRNLMDCIKEKSDILHFEGSEYEPKKLHNCISASTQKELEDKLYDIACNLFGDFQIEALFDTMWLDGCSASIIGTDRPDDFIPAFLNVRRLVEALR